jgi:hypothetical protein
MGNPREWTVGKGALVGISMIALIGAGVYAFRSFCWSNCKTVEALEITLPRADWAVGHYRMVEAGFGGIETDGLGGACVTWKSTATQSCKQDSDCDFPERMTTTIVVDPPLTKKVLRPEFAGAYAYCSPQKTCWIKVKGSDCRKSPPPLTLNQDNQTQEVNLLLVRAALYGFDSGPARIQGRVVACLNGKFTPGPGVTPPCGGGPGDVAHDWHTPQPIAVPMAPQPPLSPPG